MSSDKTIFDPGATKPETDRTVYDGDKTVLDGGTTLADAALSDAAAQTSEAPAENAAIRKGETILDTYTVESDAIEGGMGSVWRVHHKGWNVDLAMKRPQPQCFSTEKSKADFIHECEAWINLGLHPNIVSCYYVREIGGTPTIFSEWMDGGSLESAISHGALYAGSGAEQQERILDIAIQFARGLHYAHEAGLIHQDVKPDNLLLTKEGEAKVADFGLARARAVLTVMEGAPTMNETPDGGKTILSPSGGYTPAYCSMEQMDGKELTRRTDIYSWAVSVMEMYIGSRPWANGVVAGIGCKSYFKDARVPMPEALTKLLVQCMDAEPENRPHDFAEVEAKLHEIYQAETGIAYPRPAPKAAADTADSLNNRALSFLDLGKDDEAEALWKQAIYSDSSRFMYHYNYAVFLWTRCKISDIELEDRFKTQRENSPLWAKALARFALMQYNADEAEQYIALLKEFDENDAALPELAARQSIATPGSIPIGEELYKPNKLSTDGRRCVSGYYELIPHCGEFGTSHRYGYRLKELSTGEERDYPNQLEDYGESTPRDGMTYMHAHFFKSSSAHFIGPASEVVAVDADVLWLFDAKNGRLLCSLPPVYDSDGDTSTYVVDGYTNSGLIKYHDVFSPRDTYSVIRIPDVNAEFPFEVAKVASIKERLTAQRNVERNYGEATACFERDDYAGAFAALNKSFDDNTLISHEPSLRLWTALGAHLQRGKLAAVIPTKDAPTPAPERNALKAFLDPFEPSDVKMWNRTSNGQTEAFVHLKEEREYDTCNEYYDYTFSYYLTACDTLSRSEYYSIDYLLCSIQADSGRLVRDLHIEYIAENKLWMSLETHCRIEETLDLSDRECQIKHRLKFKLPGNYELHNTKDGVYIGGFSFSDSFDDFRPLWNADIIQCRKQNYRLVYRYILPE